MPRRKNISAEIEQFEAYERQKSMMKCSQHDDYFSMKTDDPIIAQIEAWRRQRKKGWCDHIDIQEVSKYSRDPSIIVVRYRCCRIRKI